jgi:DNA polymerase elongation subunit (family B)
MNVWDNEGVRYTTPDLKVMGLEIVRSSTPSVVRDSLKESVRLCLTSDEKTLHRYIEETKKDFMTKSVEDIAFPRGCNNIAKYTDVSNIYAKGTPIHVRGGLLYNHYLIERGLAKKYEKIQEGDKVKFVYLKEPNIIRENCISFIGTLPKEFDLHKYVDKELIFDKAFLEPLKTIVKTLGWKTEPENTLEDLFT